MGDDSRYRAGHPPHDVINGLRVGAFIGGVAGGLIIWLLDVTTIWIVIAGAVLGGAYGYWSERRKSRL